MCAVSSVLCWIIIKKKEEKKEILNQVEASLMCSRNEVELWAGDHINGNVSSSFSIRFISRKENEGKTVK